MSRTSRWCALALATLLALPAAAQQKGRGADALRIRKPTGPVTITADRAEFEQTGVMLYRGKVKLVSAELELTGDRLELSQPAQGQYTARISGRPARLTHAGVDGGPPVSASADQINYDSRTALVDLVENVELDRGGDTVAGERMQYDVAARRISAAGAGGSQVRIVITPPESAGDAAQSAPRPRAPGG